MSDSQATTPEKSDTADSRGAWWTRAGVILILVSGVLWGSLFVVPFLPMSVTGRIVLAGGLFAGVQVAWWTGAALAGPAVVRRIRGGFRGLFRSKAGDAGAERRD